MAAPLIPPGIGPGPGLRRGSVGTLVADTPNDEHIEITFGGPRITRSFLVKDLTGDPDHRLNNAFYVAGVPQMGDVHKAREGAFVSRVSAAHLPDSPTKARIQVEWSFFALPEERPLLEVVSVTVPKTTHFDVHGNPILLEHTFLFPPPEGELGPPNRVKGKPQVVAVDYQASEEYVIFRRREAFDPWALSRLYKGTVNGRSVFGDRPRMWMCTQLDGFTDDGGASWNVTYAFQRNIDTWDVRVIYRDPATGEGVVDPIEGKGIKWVQLYPATDFEALNLTLGEPVGPRLGFQP